MGEPTQETKSTQKTWVNIQTGWEKARRTAAYNAVKRRHAGNMLLGTPVCHHIGNDPSAGSPTETLLRLLLPLNDRVWGTFQLGVVVANLPEPVRTPH